MTGEQLKAIRNYGASRTAFYHALMMDDEQSMLIWFPIYEADARAVGLDPSLGE